ncbi:Flagellar basal-body rod protein FlgG [Sporomusa silvacetica DSM 10669]|uniref:Flagellar basal-body rod protein FlgG n=1 Tax=Sporomusa silvacetica DSM 10669 TaxID=1123289 RepID=A0ABZ3IR66_9FIRM|nr:flagellar basal-body rod protein FlgG [Sporomusa silvacetica]OZC20615.1 flagellar basal-body rod protein FlgG [Sporomusa silvacetica DSM 10669]
MIRALWTAGTGMAAQQTNLDVISNNLANVNTTGFKKGRADFADLMYQNMRQAGASTGADSQLPSGIQMGHGTRLVSTQKIYTQGSLQSTGNELDIAIQNDGFFQVTLPDGTLAYTRNGSFEKDSQGRVVTSEGYPLDPAITIPDNATAITISSEGIVTATIPSGTQELGQITLARFINDAGLESLGGNLLKETVASGAPIVTNPGEEGAGTLVQQYVEMSNVQVVEEMVNMIVAQRAYEINSKAITTADSMLETAAGLKR